MFKIDVAISKCPRIFASHDGDDAHAWDVCPVYILSVVIPCLCHNRVGIVITYYPVSFVVFDNILFSRDLVDNELDQFIQIVWKLHIVLSNSIRFVELANLLHLKGFFPR